MSRYMVSMGTSDITICVCVCVYVVCEDLYDNLYNNMGMTGITM